MKIAQSKMAKFFAGLLIWALVMSLISIVAGNELNATVLGVIIFGGAIVSFLSLLMIYIMEITQSKIPLFFMYLLLWVSSMTFVKGFIFGDRLNATGLGVDFFMGTIVAFFSVLVIHKSEKSSRR